MKIDFEFETQYGTFADSLFFDDEQPIPSDEEIESMKQQRLSDWLTFVDSSSKE